VGDGGARAVSDWICGRPPPGTASTPPRPVVATVVVDGDALVVVVGAVDRFSWVDLEAGLLDVLAAGGRSVVLDARQVPFVDATVVSRLASLGRRLLAERGGLRIVSAPPVLQRLVDLLLIGDALVVEPRA
jgi:anti-anti-sigma regulatory factor